MVGLLESETLVGSMDTRSDKSSSSKSWRAVKVICLGEILEEEGAAMGEERR